ncbi:Mucin-associated surface protein (MASP) [Trypanosoma cruzi]|nr:Mucin-associated surface protein (MASP) [Trypanosoma cruzi]RNC51909.1 mucin-associated surface protein (MASP) [Trypanosoma cruzi]
MKCVLLLLVFATVPCHLLLSLYVDGELFCAEGYTQVTGVMMTGRVLLVCALCVLWCGAGGRCNEGLAEGRAGVSGSDVEPPPAPTPLVTSPQDTQSLHGRVSGVKEKLSPASSTPTEEEDDDDEEDDSDEAEAQEGSIEGQGGKGGTAASEPGSGEKNLSGSKKETGQAIVSAEGISHSGSRESNANPTQTEVEEKKNTDKNTPAVENAITTGNGENTLPAGIAGGNLPSLPEDSVDSHEQDGEDATSEGKKNVPLPETAATPQSHQENGSEGTVEDTKATTVTSNTTDTTNTQNSDSSTAVSHATSPLLVLLVVACAAAPAVVAA